MVGDEVRVLVCDPQAGSIEEDRWPSGTAAFGDRARDALGCTELEVVDLAEIVGTASSDLVWLDGEGLLGEATGYWRAAGGTRLHAGRFVVSGPAADGRVSAVATDPDALGARIAMFGARVTFDPAKPDEEVPGAATPVVVRTR